MVVVSTQRGISLSFTVSRQLEIYKSDNVSEAVRDIKDGNTLLVGGTSDENGTHNSLSVPVPSCRKHTMVTTIQ